MLKSKTISPQLIDGMIYLMGMPVILVSAFVGCVDILKILLLPAKQGLVFLQEKLILGAIFIILSMFHALWIVRLEKKDVKKLWKGIITYPIFLVVSFFVNFASFFNMNLQWKQIKHESKATIDDMK